jgi:hypothetical protein
MALMAKVFISITPMQAAVVAVGKAFQYNLTFYFLRLPKNK